MTRTIVLALAAVFVVTAAEAATIQKARVFEFQSGPPGFAVGNKVGGAHATVYRNDGGVAVILKTKKLSEGASTTWLFECVGGSTTEHCLHNGPLFCSADTVGDNGKMHLACGISQGDPGLMSPLNPFVLLILHHGAIDPEMIHLQLSVPMPPPTVPVQTIKVEAGGTPVEEQVADNDDDDDDDDDDD